MKDELNKLLGALGQGNCGVKRQTATFFDLQRDKNTQLKMLFKEMQNNSGNINQIQRFSKLSNHTLK